MKRLFFYRLFLHSKSAFVLLILFMCIYAVTFFKKMDMALFPYNNMYTIDFAKSPVGETYAMKIKGKPVPVSDKLYWKKDFLETSMNGFVRYLQNDQKVFLHDYLTIRLRDENLRKIFLMQLKPNEKVVHTWPKWYASYAGCPITPGASLEIWKYKFKFTGDGAVLIDSMLVHKNSLPQ